MSTVAASKPVRTDDAHDVVRDAILRHLFEVHRLAKGPTKVAVRWTACLTRLFIAPFKGN